MPNHVINNISLRGGPKKIRLLLETVKSDKIGAGSIDFNKVIPMPESLNIETSSRTDQGLKAYRDFIEAYTVGHTEVLTSFGKVKRKEWEVCGHECKIH